MKPRYYLAILAHCAFIFYMSHQSDPPTPEIGLPHMDKVAHAILYGFLATLVSLGLHRSGRIYRPAVYHLVPVLFALLYGISDEIHQYFVPPRTPDVFDLVADFTGALLAQEAIAAWHRWHPAPELPQPDETGCEFRG